MVYLNPLFVPTSISFSPFTVFGLVSAPTVLSSLVSFYYIIEGCPTSCIQLPFTGFPHQRHCSFLVFGSFVTNSTSGSPSWLPWSFTYDKVKILYFLHLVTVVIYMLLVRRIKFNYLSMIRLFSPVCTEGPED